MSASGGHVCFWGECLLLGVSASRGVSSAGGVCFIGGVSASRGRGVCSGGGGGGCGIPACTEANTPCEQNDKLE